MPKNASVGATSTSAIVSGVIIIVIILAFGYLLMNGQFSMTPGGIPAYTPNP